ncbi:TCV-interacting protein [Raphanus sativus]|nr:TCV-interacting protein [Raphanus sativus]
MHEYRATEKDLDGTKPGQSRLSYASCLRRKMFVSGFPTKEEPKHSDVAESSLVVSGECQSDISAPEVTTTELDHIDWKLVSGVRVPGSSHVLSLALSGAIRARIRFRVVLVMDQNEPFRNQNGAHIQTQYGSNDPDQYMFDLWIRLSRFLMSYQR